MKKTFVVCLCICVLCALSAPVLAVDLQDYQYINADGVVVVDIDGYNAALAAEKVAAAGLDLDVDSFWKTDIFGTRYFDNASFERAFDEAQTAAQEAQVPPQVPDDPMESVGAGDESDVVPDVPFVYPAGSYMDAAGNMWSPDGELLSPGTTPAPEGIARPSEEAILVDSDASEDIPVEVGTPVYRVIDLRSAAGTFGASDGIVEYSTSSDPVLVGNLGNIAQVYGVGVKSFSFSSQSSVASIEMLDGYSSLTGYLRLGTGVSGVTIDGVDTNEFTFTTNGQYTVVFHTSDGNSPTCLFNISNLSDTPAPAADGLKALVVSIFGKYTPVMTTGTVMETVDNVTTTTLLDTVAPGAAGVDYEWCAGVLLFGILLFCLMKLLGGVLK